MSELGAIEKLRREHLLDRFDCGKEDLNRFLIRQAWNNQQAHSAQTYVLAKDLRVLGYYSLAAASVSHDEATQRVKKGLARHPEHAAPHVSVDARGAHILRCVENARSGTACGTRREPQRHRWWRRASFRD